MANLLMEMEIFYYVAMHQSFSHAARHLNISKSYVSQQISALEKELGVKLLQRSTRQLKLTDAGEILFISCAKIIKEKKLASTLIEETKTEPLGNLKITAPPSMCSSFLAKVIPEFLSLYPKIKIELDSSSNMKDLFSDNVDIAIRITQEPDPNCIAKLLGSFKFMICANPHYLKKHSQLVHPKDLRLHNCLVYHAQLNANHWKFANTEIQVEGNLSSSDSEVIHAALLAGKGIARLPQYVVDQDVKAGRVISLLEEYYQMSTPIYILYPGTYTASPKIKCFIEYLKKHFSDNVNKVKKE